MSEVEGQAVTVIDSLSLISNPLPLKEDNYASYYKGESRIGSVSGCNEMNAALVCSVALLGSTDCITRLAYDLASSILKLFY